MSEKILENVLNGDIPLSLLVQWLNYSGREVDKEEFDVFQCTRSDFVIKFVTFIRKQTETIISTNCNLASQNLHQNTPDKMLQRKDSTSSLTSSSITFETPGNNCNKKHIQVTTLASGSKTNRLVKTKLFNDSDETAGSNESNLSTPLCEPMDSLQIKTADNTKLVSKHNCASPTVKSDTTQYNINTSASESVIITSTPVKNTNASNVDSELTSHFPDSPITPLNSLSVQETSRHNHYSLRLTDPSHLKERTNDKNLTPISKSHTKTHTSLNKSNISERLNISLGDYIVSSAKPGKKKKSFKNISGDSSVIKNHVSQNESGLDLSDIDMFPEIGAKKITQRHIKSNNQKRRIKPTSLNEKITTENMGNVERTTFKNSDFLVDSYKPNPIVLEENEAFKQQKFQPKEESQSFDVERSILKKDRHKLMEKFNVLNTGTNTVKITQSSPKIQTVKCHKKSETYIEPDLNHVKFTQQLDSLVNIYDALLNANLVLNLSTEIYFLISLCVSQQTLKDYNGIDSKSNSGSSSFNSKKCNNTNSDVADIDSSEFLGTIHNCLYFSVKMLWKQRFVLEVMLDKHSLRLLGENKRVRSFSPELTKFLIDQYCLKYEFEVLNSQRDFVSANVLESRFAGDGNVCFNSETDNADNFPTGQSFSNFRKQRDIFYELLGFWEKGGRGSRMQQKVKELMHLAIAPANRAHLARLLRDHILAECTQSLQETKLTKLTRRLTGPAPVNDNHKTPKFSGREAFYREVLELADSDAFRSHVRDCFSTELVNIDNSTHITYQDKVIESSTEEAERKLWYLCTVRKCRALAKFLGLTVSLPYMTVPNTATNANGRRTDVDKDGRPLKEKVLANELSLREQTQPPLDLIYLLQNSYQNNRLSITVPWLVQYLAMLDYTSLRLKYYTDLLRILFRIYLTNLKVEVVISYKDRKQFEETDTKNSKITDKTVKNSMRVLLNLCLGSLFESPHFPQQLFYDWLIEMSFECERDIFAFSFQKINVNRKISNSLTVASNSEIEVSDVLLDFEDLADENLISEICPQVKEIGVVLMHWNQQSGQTSRESSGPSFRHITPVTMSFDATDKVKNKEKELQARLEEQFIRSQAPWTRRVLELVSERAASAVCRDLTAQHLPDARLKAKKETLELLAQRNSTKKATLEQQIQHIYERNLTSLHDCAYKEAPGLVRARAAGALDALLAAAVPRAPLIAAASKAGVARVERWIRDNWQTTDILKKDIKSEVERYLVLNQDVPPSQSLETGRDFKAITAPSDEFEAKNLSPACVIMELRDLICKSLIGEIISIQNLWLVLQRTEICCSPTNVFITAHSKLMLFQLSVDSVVCVAGTSPNLLTEETLENFGKIWDLCCPNRPEIDLDKSLNLPERREDLSPEPRNFVEEENMSIPSTPEDVVIPPDGIAKIVILDKKKDEDISPTTKNNDKDSESKGLMVFFERILCPRNMAILTEVQNNTDPKLIWSAVANIMLYLLKNRFLTQDSLTEQCLAVYRQDWPQPVLDLVAGCMRQVSHSWGHPRDTKFTLFLDFLAEYCNNMDVEIDQEHNIDSDLQFSLE